jgi:glutamyl-Q tRNA(Asp) synthetase
LHFGSLIAATASYLEARSQGGQWLVRIEDVDTPRCSRAWGDDILRTLERFGFSWDGQVVWQSERTAAYETALARLREIDAVFPCACTRRELADSEIHGVAQDGAALYPGTCRNGLPAGKRARAWRLRVGKNEIEFVDALQGRINSPLAVDVGDFVVRRADQLFAYQLAVVVDDADAEITHVVRGADLLHSTPRQVWLQRCLGLPTPKYAHVPVIVNTAGEKLSKQSGATALTDDNPATEIVSALAFLGQQPPRQLNNATVADVWHWAHAHWSLSKMPRLMTQRLNETE